MIPLLVIILASPQWFGIPYLHPYDVPQAHVALRQLDFHVVRISINTDEIMVNGWDWTDKVMATNLTTGATLILVVEPTPINETITRQFLDRYPNFKIVEACNEPADIGVACDAIRAWKRLLLNRNPRPVLAAPSNQNTTDPLGYWRVLKTNGLASACSLWSGHEYSGKEGGGSWPPNHDSYTHPDEDYGGMGTALRRYLNLNAFTGKRGIITEFAFHDSDQRDAAVWAATFTAAKVLSVNFQWPQQQAGISQGGLYDWATTNWTPTMVTFTNTANILNGGK